MVSTRSAPRLLACVASLGLCAAAAPSASSSTVSNADLTRYIEQARTDWANIGAAVAVVQGDTVVYANGFGVREHGKSAPIDADTLFQIASTTKAFTSAALGMLVEEGKVRWDDPVVSYVPAFQLADPWVTRQMTIRDALSHRAGIRSTYYSDFGPMSADEALRQLRYVTPKAFRDGYRYDNLMYGVADRVVAAASGMSWREFVRQRLFAPLKMDRSHTSPYELWDADDVAPTFFGSARANPPDSTRAHDKNVAMPHLADERGSVQVLAWQSYDFAAGAGALVSSASDMAHWVMLNLNEGRFAGKQVLKQETVRELHAAQNPRLDSRPFPFDEPLEGYAMGWERGRYRNAVHLAHGGSLQGVKTYVAMLPEKHVGIVVLTNGRRVMEYGDGFAFHKSIAFWLFDRSLGAPRRNWSAEFLERVRTAETDAKRRASAVRAARLQDAPPSLPLDQYVGDYENRSNAWLESGPILNGRIRVSLVDGALVLGFMGEGAFTATLRPWHHDVFLVQPKIPVNWQEFVGFALSPDARINAFTLFGQTFIRVPSAGSP